MGLTSALSGPSFARPARRRRDNLGRAYGARVHTHHGPLQRIVRRPTHWCELVMSGVSLHLFQRVAPDVQILRLAIVTAHQYEFLHFRIARLND
jgi:hypothetical protein